MAAVWSGARDPHNRMFASVFPTPNYTTPTPDITPQIGTLASPGQPFGGPTVLPAAVEATVQRALAWSTATKFLSLPQEKPLHQLQSRNVRLEVRDALQLLLADNESNGQESLLDWYRNEIRHHFQQFVLPDLQLWGQSIPADQASDLLNRTTALLGQAQGFYLRSLRNARLQGPSNALLTILDAFERSVARAIHTLVLHSLPHQRLMKVLSTALYNEMVWSLENSDQDACRIDGVCQCHCSIEQSRLALSGLCEVGLGGNLAQQAFAHAVHRLLQGPVINRRCVQVDWAGQGSVVPLLKAWMRHHFASTVRQTLSHLTGSDQFSETDVVEWECIAVENLGRSRVGDMFDFVKAWPQASGGIYDIKEYLANPFAKAHVCAVFEAQLKTRILHAGATTSDILSIYVNVIDVFKFLDPRGVLLEKVSVPIRTYLRGRDDTVDVIAQSFLAEVDENGMVVRSAGDNICADIAREVEASGGDNPQDHRSLDWNDMNWMPDPIDAGPDWKSSKTDDIIAHVLNLFEAQDFLTAIQKILSNHLLQQSPALEYEKETRLVELFKARFGQDKLQQCEVMLKDMRDSAVLERKIKGSNNTSTGQPTPAEVHEAIPEDGIVLAELYTRFQHRMVHERFLATVKLVAVKRKDIFFPKRMHRRPQRSFWQQAPIFHAQIVSKNFWPAMLESEFNLPSPLTAVQEKYSDGYERLKGQQRLRWQPALGNVDVHLQLEDRELQETVQPAFASVIYAFQQPKSDHCLVDSSPMSLTISQLEEILGMDEDLLRQALTYWTALRVLMTSDHEIYAVLERLPTESPTEPLLSAQDMNAAISATQSQDALFKSQQATFENTIVSMLTNAGSMAPAQMLMMLKFALQSFTYGEAELQWLLDQLVAGGTVVRNSEVYAIVK